MSTIKAQTRPVNSADKVQQLRGQVFEMLNTYLNACGGPDYTSYEFIGKALRDLLMDGTRYCDGYDFLRFIMLLEAVISLPEQRKLFQDLSGETWTDHGIETNFRLLKEFFLKMEEEPCKAELYTIELLNGPEKDGPLDDVDNLEELIEELLKFKTEMR
jgi:hypothetical protein